MTINRPHLYLKSDKEKEFVLRAITESDARPIAKHADNINIWRNVRDLFPNPYTVENALEFIRQAGEYDKDIIRGIEADGQIVGIIGLHSRPDVYKINMELGFWLGEEYWGQGIMSSAVKEIIKLGFERDDVKRIYAEVFEHNTGSCRVLEKSGFRREAILENAIEKDGIIEDVYIYSISRKEYLNLAAK